MATQSAASSSTDPASTTDPLAALAYLQQQFMQLQHVVQQQGNQTAQQLAAAHQAVQAVQQPLQVAPSVRLPKIAPPPRFKGDMNTVDTFIRAIDQQCEYYGISGGAKLQFAFAHLELGALTWLTGMAAKPTTWAEFTTKLYARYRPVEVAMMARTKLGALKQGRNSVTAYTNAFQTILTPISDMGEADQVHYYIFGLTPEVFRRVMEKRPSSLAEAIELAASIEASISFASRGAISSSSYHHGGNRASSSSSSGSVPMDINNVVHEEFEEDSVSPPRFHDEPINHSVEAALLAKIEAMEHKLAAVTMKYSSASSSKGSDRVPGIKSGDIDRLMKENRCFRCQKVGHRKNECPQNKSVSFNLKSKQGNY